MSPAEARRHCFRNAIEHVHLGHRAAMGPGMPQGYERNLRRIHVSRIVSTSVCQSVLTPFSLSVESLPETGGERPPTAEATCPE
jgi:hypothetical protein